MEKMTMFEALCIYGVNCAKGIKVGCLIWAFLCLGGGGVALDAGDIEAARKHGFIMLVFAMVAMLFPDTETWRGWLEMARRP